MSRKRIDVVIFPHILHPHSFMLYLSLDYTKIRTYVLIKYFVSIHETEYLLFLTKNDLLLIKYDNLI